MKLTDEQEKGLDQLKSFINDKHSKYFLLQGYAGTGKSTLINEFINWYQTNRGIFFDELVITAPTNKAVNVLKRLSTHAVDYKTLHSLLGLKYKITDDGKEVFEKDKYTKPTVYLYGCVIVDESSMIDDEIFQELIDTAFDQKIIFVGDPAQIPPVNHFHSKPMMKDFQDKLGFEVFTLNSIVRQAEDNPIIKTSLDIRKGTFEKTIKDDRDSEGRGVVQLDWKVNKDKIYELLKENFCGPEFNKDSDYAKVIAWRNKTVKGFNDLIRSFLYYENVNRVVVGEKIIANRPILDNESKPLVFVNDDLVVVDLEVEEEKFYGKTIKYYNAKVEKLHSKKERVTLQIIHEDSDVSYENVLKSLKTIAIQSKPNMRGKSWGNYYKFRDNFADVSYNYSITAHKCISKGEMIITGTETKPQWIPIENVEIGDMVRTGNGNFKRVSNKWNSGEKEEYVLVTKSGRKLKSSKDHKLMQFDGEDFIWKPLGELNVGQYVCIDRSYSKLEERIDTDWKYWYYGAILGDGSYNYSKKNENRIDLTMHKDDSYLFSNIPYVFKQYFPKNRNIEIACIHNKELKNELTHLGFVYDENRTKIFPGFFRECSLGQKASIIRGLMDTDGSASSDRNVVRFVNVSESIVDGLRDLLLDFGIISNKVNNKPSSNNHKVAYTLSITGSSLENFRKYIGFELKRKQQILENYDISLKTNTDNIPNCEIVKSNIKSYIKENRGIVVPNKDRTYFNILDIYKNLSYDQLEALKELSESQDIDFKYDSLLYNRFYFDEILSVEKSGNFVEMYDIEVEDDHSFICNGMVVHNCQGSTYNKAFVFYSDIAANPNMIEMQRILYTASTRPSDTLFIL